MTDLDWHGERGAFAHFDREPAELIDSEAVRHFRQARVRAMMAERGIDALILTDPVNIRYATGARNMQVFTSRNPAARYLLLTAENAILYDFSGCAHLASGLPTLTDIRPALTASFVAAGERIAEREQTWAREMSLTLRPLVGRRARIGLERVNAGAALALTAETFELVDAQAAVERARAIKSAEELKCIAASLRATETAVGLLETAVRPGMTENALWSILHQAVIALDGDYVETRLLNSGSQSNPWFQECGTKRLLGNELVALDTDVVGCHGYYSDFSRTFHVGPDRPSAAQRELYRHTFEQVQHNIGIIAPGMSFRDYADRAWPLPQKYFANRYYLSAHGCGMTGEYPYLYYRADFPDAGHDGVIEPGMTLCVESYIGEVGGTAGVKLEEQILVTETGTEVLSRYPFASALLAD